MNLKAPHFKLVFLLFLLTISFNSISQTCGTTVSTFPYTQNFENTLGSWTQDTGDDINWTNDSGGTPSSNTGPSSGDGDTWYMYIEASGNGTGYPSKVANFESPCFDFTSIANPEFTYSYHMYGTDVGTLNVDISTDNGATYPTTLRTYSGNLGNSWNQDTIDLSAYSGLTVKIRFNGTTGSTGSGWSSDIAIDNVSITNSTPAPEINITGLGNTILDGDTTPITTDDTDFGSVITAAGSNTNIFTIENLGTTDLTLSNPILTGDTADFTVTVNPTSPVSASGNTTFTIIFDPTVDGIRTAIVSIANNDSDENPYTFTITGTGYTPAPEINITGLGNTIVDGDTTPTTTDDSDFGNVDITIGTQVNTFTIENIGTLGLNLTGASPYVAISGAADFSVTAIPSNSIAASGSTTFAVTFNPTTVGLKTATLTIANNDSDENPYNFDIQGTGTTTTYSQVIVSVDWPNWSSENTVEIYSPSGTLISTITDPTGTGDSSYSTTANLGCLEDLNNYYFIMYDTYGDGWNGTNNITITVNGIAVVNQNGNAATSGGTTVNFNVSGGSSAAEISISGNSIEIVDGDITPSTSDNTDFGKVQFGVETTVKTFLIENQSCSTSLNLTGASPYITILGPNAADFSVTTIPTTPILAGGSTTFAITFNPTTAGIKNAIITIDNDDTDENPYNFDITGESIAPLPAGPGGVKTGLKLWLKSTAGLGYADGASVSTWGDQGLGSNATVNTTGQEPTFKDNATDNVNFNPVVDFNNSYNPVPKDGDYSFDDTTTQFLEGTGGFYTQDIFVVLVPDATVDNSFGSMDIFCGDEDEATDAEDATGIGYGTYSLRFTDEVISYAVGTTTDIGGGVQDGYGVAETSTSISYTNVGIINARNNGGATQQKLYHNANDIETTQNDIPDFSNVDNSRYWIGRSEGWEASADARIAEIITYSSRQTDVDLTDKRNRIQSYLAIKYGITLGANGTSQDYVDSDGTVIWDQSANSGYNYDIAGIGRDDASDLNQKQSSSVNNATDGSGPIEGILTIGLTDLYATNNDNITTNSANTFNDKNLLVWGNNGANLNLAASVITVNMSAGITPTLITNVTFTGMQRIWKVVENGGDIPKVKVSIPQNAIRNISPPGSYLMFISNTSVFDPTADYRVLTSDGSGNLETTYDFDGTKYITFGYAPQVVVERSIYFDGAVDYIDMEDALDLNTSNFTISAWIKRGSGSADTSILSKRDAAYTEGYDYKINAAGRFEMSWKNGSTQTITSDVVIPENQWHHVAIIYSGGTANLYIDGVLDKTASLSAPVNTTQSFYIAAAGKTATTNFYIGNIDEVRVWDTALTVDQLRYVMNQEIIENATFTDGNIIPTSISKNDVGTIPWTNLAGYYPMSVYTYTNTNDESGNSNQGALRNLNTVDFQTAPLPYKSTQNGNWDTNSTWLNGSEQTIPGAISIVDNTKTVDWNIVETNHNLTMDNSSLPVSNNGNRTLLGLVVQNNELTLSGNNATNTGNAVTITHYLKIDGALDLEGESQLIQTDGSDLAVSSAGYIEKDQQGTENSFTYNYWSAPVSLIGAGTNNTPFTIADILKDGTDPANPLTPNFAYSYTHADGALSTPRKIATYWIWNFVNQGNAYANWNWIGANKNLNVTEGYTMKGTSGTGAISDDQNFVFIGKPNNVLNGATELIHTTFGVPADPTNPEVSLTGNPFPSAIDANQFITDNLASTDGQLLFWEHWGGGNHNVGDYQGGYATRTIATGVPAASHPDVDQTGTGSKTPGQYVAVAQGFFITSSATGGNVVFKNSQRVFEKEGGASSVFFRGTSTKNKKNNTERNGLGKMTLRLGFESPNGFHRQIAAVFNIDGATDDIEKGYDGYASDILSNDAFFIQDDKYFVIQAYGDFNELREIPIVIVIDEDNDGGLQKIMIDKLENIPDKVTIYIKDNLSGETHNLKNNTFEINLSSGIYKDRFSIVFKSQSSLSVEDEVIKNGITAYMNNSTSTIKITNNTDAEIQKVVLYNVLGQQSKIWLKRLTERELNLIVQNLSTGVYILKIETNKVNINKKLIIE